jgi:hypothetical protein
MVIIGWGRWKKNGIYLRDARQDQKSREKNRNERIEKIVLAVVSAILGGIATLAISHFKR